jgi:two-component system sensor histidine kinase PhoQ
VILGSLRSRLLLASIAVLIIFLNITGIALDRAFRNSVIAGETSRLSSYIYDLIRVADPTSGSVLSMSSTEADHRLMSPGSGLYAAVLNGKGEPIWRSPSMLGLKIPFHEKVLPGEEWFGEIKRGDGKELFSMSMGINWVDHEGREQTYIFSVADTQDAYQEEIENFRSQLWFLFGVALAVLFLVHGLVLYWGFDPVRKIEEDLSAIERGDKEAIDSKVPTELTGLTENLNALIKHEHMRQARYRNALGDLAHSFKTPLAILRSAVERKESDKDEIVNTVAEQVERLDQIVRSQLQRAVTAGKAALAKPIYIAPIVQKIERTLQKVYADKHITCEMILDDKARFRGQEGDFFEMAGNLIENAFKYTSNEVKIITRKLNLKKDGRTGIEFIIEDNGSGIPAEETERILRRGERADTSKPGHGIGLSMSKDIISAYDGTLAISSSESGGARIEVFFPR